MPDTTSASPNAPGNRSEEQPVGDADVARYRQRLGSIIRRHRRIIDPPLSQQAVADELGTVPSAISDWERGESVPSAISLLLLVRFLRIDPVELLTIFDEELPNGEEAA